MEIHGRVRDSVFQDTDPFYVNSPVPSQPRRQIAVIRRTVRPDDPETNLYARRV